MNRVENLTKISQGYNSEIYLWKCQSQENLRNLVLKVVDLSYPDQANILINEYQILKNIQHDNILKVIDLKKDMQILGSHKHVLITEYAPKASLFDLLAEKKTFDIRIVRSFFKQIASAVHYLHGQNICHRDIKLENILVFEDFQMKLADFGFSNKFENLMNEGNGSANCNTFQGTVRGYMPPEILRLQINRGRVPYNGFKADIFSLGVLLFVIVFGSLPFEKSRETDRQFKYIITKNYSRFWQMFKDELDILENQPGSMIPELKELLQNMLSFNPDERPTSEQVVNHSWMEGTTLDPKNNL